MEVFMRNLPPDLTDNNLKNHLAPIVQSIGAQDWSCQKQRHKKFGNVTFLHPSDGIKFLAKHDKDSNQQARPFKILNFPNNAPRHIYYKSDKILGKLYQAIDEQKIWYDNIKTAIPYDTSVYEDLLIYLFDECRDKFGSVAITEDTFDEAWEIRGAYEDGIHNTSQDYSEHASRPLTELEVFTGDIFNRTGTQTRRQRDKSTHLRDEFARIAKWAENMMLKREKHAAVDDDDDVRSQVTTATEVDGLALSLACLYICIKKDDEKDKRHNIQRTGRSGGKFQSFKVVAACACIRALRAAVAAQAEGGVSLFNRV